MADIPVSAGSAAAAALGAMEIPVNDAGVSKKITVDQLVTYMNTKGKNRCTRLGTQHQLASATGTKVTGLDQTLEVGTFAFQYSLLVQSSLAGTSPMLGVNFTGTGTPKMQFSFSDATSAITAELHTMDDQGSTAFGYISGMANAVESTTAPNMGATPGVAAINTDILCFIQGLLVVTVSGNLELWHGSETANNTSVEVGSSLVVCRTA